MSPRSIAIAALLSPLFIGCTAPGQMPWGGVWGPPPARLELHPITGPELRRKIGEADAELVLVNVWATWCTSCREEFPDLLGIRRTHSPRGLAVVIVSGDFPSESERALEFLATARVDFPTYIKKGKDMEFIDALHREWSGALPATFLYADGQLVDWWEGSASYQEFAAAVDEALAVKSGRAQ